MNKALKANTLRRVRLMNIIIKEMQVMAGHSSFVKVGDTTFCSAYK